MQLLYLKLVHYLDELRTTVLVFQFGLRYISCASLISSCICIVLSRIRSMSLCSPSTSRCFSRTCSLLFSVAVASVARLLSISVFCLDVVSDVFLAFHASNTCPCHSSKIGRGFRIPRLFASASPPASITAGVALFAPAPLGHATTVVLVTALSCVVCISLTLTTLL